MTAETEFAQALAGALGPLYRVSVVGSNGDVEATFRAPDQAEAGVPSSRIGLPGSSSCLVVEVDVGALQAADRVLHELARARWETSIGLPNLDGALEELISDAESRIGRPVAEMSRIDKQRLVKFLDERGAFSLRKSVEGVALVLGVSRFTVYNYLDASRGS